MKNKNVSVRRFFFQTTIILLAALSSQAWMPEDAGAAASVTPVSVAIVPPIQFPSDEFTVTGARLSFLWGRHRDLYGLDFGAIGNITTQSFVGVAVSGVFNYTQGMTRILALQAAGVANISSQKTQVYGLQVAGGMNWITAESTVVGLQAALIGNHSPSTNIYGAQIGLYNRAKEVYGLQIGLVNFAKSLHGIQIGLANINETGIFGISPIINIGF